MALKSKRKHNYLNNKDILKEIHRSKTSYCSFVDPDYNHYDLIIDKPSFTIEECLEFARLPAQIEAGKIARAKRLSEESETKIAPSSIDTNDLVFRIMTWDHIPVAKKEPRKIVRKKTAKDIFVMDDTDDLSYLTDDTIAKDEVDDMVHVKVNFPPFQHYKLDDSDQFQCVGKSHWEGGMQNGYFNKDHGSITNKLARMYLMMCERFSMKFNWRRYTYRDEMQASAVLQLTYVGLRFNEARSANPFAYFTVVANNSFVRVLNTEKRNQNIRDDILEENGMTPSFSRQLKDISPTTKKRPTTGVGAKPKSSPKK